MSAIDVMRKALDALEYHTAQTRPVLGTEAAIAALRAEIERLGAAPSLTCQTFGEGVAVPCAECNTVLVDSQELAELRAMAARMATVEPVA